jgi:5-hydroxyisourate hydrolase
MAAGGISVHAVDVARGRVAEGMRVEIARLTPGGGRVVIAEGRIGPTGLMDHPVARGAGIEPGEHEVLFHIGEWHGDPQAFLGVVPFRFRVADVAPHIHLPIKFTPFGFSLYRGA